VRTVLTGATGSVRYVQERTHLVSTLTRERDDLRKQLEEKSKVLAEIQTNGFKDEDGKIVVSEKARTEFTKELREAKAMRGRLAELGEFEEITSYLNDPGAESKSIAGGGGNSGLILPRSAACPSANASRSRPSSRRAAPTAS
jgi:hypothetical protein